MTEEQPKQQQTGPMQIAVSMQYIKDFSFESPNVPQIFAQTKLAPEMNMGVNVHTRPMMGAHNTHEVVLVLKLEAKVEGKTAFIAELSYGGIFTLPALPEEQAKLFLLIECPRLLFPFARAILGEAVRDGGFPQILINPIDFAGLYQANKGSVGPMVAAGSA